MALRLVTRRDVEIEGLPENWMVKAIMLDNEDVTDRPIELRNGRPNARASCSPTCHRCRRDRSRLRR